PNSGTGNNPNASGQFVGFADVGAGLSHGFLYSNGVMSDLNLMVDGSAAGWVVSDGVAINDSGFITGEGFTPTGQTHAFLLTLVPINFQPPVSQLPASSPDMQTLPGGYVTDVGNSYGAQNGLTYGWLDSTSSAAANTKYYFLKLVSGAADPRLNDTLYMTWNSM